MMMIAFKSGSHKGERGAVRRLCGEMEEMLTVGGNGATESATCSPCIKAVEWGLATRGLGWHPDLFNLGHCVTPVRLHSRLGQFHGIDTLPSGHPFRRFMRHAGIRLAYYNSTGEDSFRG